MSILLPPLHKISERPGVITTHWMLLDRDYVYYGHIFFQGSSDKLVEVPAGLIQALGLDPDAYETITPTPQEAELLAEIYKHGSATRGALTYIA